MAGGEGLGDAHMLEQQHWLDNAQPAEHVVAVEDLADRAADLGAERVGALLPVAAVAKAQPCGNHRMVVSAGRRWWVSARISQSVKATRKWPIGSQKTAMLERAIIGKWFLLACLLLSSASGCARLPKADSKAALAESPSTPTSTILPKARKSSFVMTVEVNVNLSVPLDVEKVKGSTLPNRFSVDCDGDGRWDHVKASVDVICRYKKPGKYTIRIAGHIDNLRLRCNKPSSQRKMQSDILAIDKPSQFDVLSVDEWGPNKWYSMESFSTGCKKMHLKTKSAPDLSRCISLKRMFYNAEKMNEPLDHWDVSKVRTMRNAFRGAKSFNQPLEKWNVSNVKDMRAMFYGATSFNQPLEKWNVSNVKNMIGMFAYTKSFNQPLEKWNVSNVKHLRFMFWNARSFNQPLEKWNISNVKIMIGVFEHASSFNQPLEKWNVSNVKHMTNMFKGATSFNQPLEKWNVSNVYDIGAMFAGAKSFNQPLENWNVSNVAYMSAMFRGATSFNQPLEKWNVSNVVDMSDMFNGATSFNQPLEKWSVSNVVDMGHMFNGAKSFNQPLEKWNVSNVKHMTNMFKGATSFKQSLKRWRLHPNVDVDPRSSR